MQCVLCNWVVRKRYDPNMCVPSDGVIVLHHAPKRKFSKMFHIILICRQIIQCSGAFVRFMLLPVRVKLLCYCCLCHTMRSRSCQRHILDAIPGRAVHRFHLFVNTNNFLCFRCSLPCTVRMFMMNLSIRISISYCS